MKGIRIRPEHDGIRSFLFDLEADIMEIVWSQGWTEFAVGAVHDRLGHHADILTTRGDSFRTGKQEQKKKDGH